jgi:4-oxalocrotonate tautomerase
LSKAIQRYPIGRAIVSLTLFRGRRTLGTSATEIHRRRKIMPHVIVKLYAGRSAQVKAQLADEMAKAIKTVLKSEDKSISVAIEDVAPEEWAEKVYKPDILDKPDNLLKKPGYNPFG